MKTFEEFITENLAWYSEKIGDREFKIIDSNHGLERTIERNSSHELQTKLAKNIINYFSKNEEKYKNDDETFFLFYSKSLKRGLVIKFSYDRTSKAKQIIVISVTPEKPENQIFAKSGTKKIILENKQDFFVNVDEYMSDYLQQFKPSEDNLYFNTFILESNNYPLEIITSDGVSYDIAHHVCVTIE